MFYVLNQSLNILRLSVTIFLRKKNAINKVAKIFSIKHKRYNYYLKCRKCIFKNYNKILIAKIFIKYTNHIKKGKVPNIYINLKKYLNQMS